MAEFTERYPLIGGPVNQDDQSIIDTEIVTANSYGIDVFDFDWFWTKGAGADGGFNDYAIRRFKQSVNARLMRFCARPILNGWTGTLDDFREMLQTLKLNFAHPSYYRIHGRPVVFLFGLDDVATALSGIYPDHVIAMAALVREMRAQLGKCYVVGTNRVPHADYFGPNGINARIGYDATSHWVWIWKWSQSNPPFAWGLSTMPPLAANYSEAMAENALAAQWIASQDRAPYIPMLCAGRDGTPWDDGITQYGSTPAEFEAHCLAIRDVMDKQNDPKIINTYSWNEHGEGGIVAPTNGSKYAYLEALRRVFKPELLT